MFRERKRVAWTAEEDERLRRFVARYGTDQWSTASHRAKLQRDGSACRERWHFYLGPGIQRGHITAEEEDHIIRLHAVHGDRWFQIACQLPGRTEKDVRNHWRRHLSQRLVEQGIDPRTHKPMVKTEPEEGSSSPQQSTEAADDGGWDSWEMVPLPEPETTAGKTPNRLCEAFSFYLLGPLNTL